MDAFKSLSNSNADRSNFALFFSENVPILQNNPLKEIGKYQQSNASNDHGQCYNSGLPSHVKLTITDSSNISIGRDASTINNSVLIFGFDISHWPKYHIFAFGSVGIFVSYIFFGILQEYLFTVPDLRENFLMLICFQFFVSYLLASVECFLVKQSFIYFQPWLYFSIGFASVTTVLLSNAAVALLNYPTQVIFKCCKLIPVMLGSILINQRRYLATDYLAVLLMVVGLIFFTLTDIKVQPQFNFIGVLAISIALCADGCVGNLQELALKKYNIPSLQILSYTYLCGFGLLVLAIIASGSISASLLMFFHHPMTIFVYGTLFAVSNYFGMQFILLMAYNFGALSTVIVTNMRKAVSITLSFIVFSKPFSFGYVWSGGVVFLGIILNSYGKMKSEKDKIEMKATLK